MKKKSILIKDTTRKEREQIVMEALSCGSGGCDHCASCHLGAGDPFEMYRDYIEGKKEIAEINMAYRTSYLK